MATSQQVLKTLEEKGMLLLTDPSALSVAGLIAGAPVRGTWWSHPKGQEIFRTCGELEDHDDVDVVKLVSGKVTFVHRALWPALVAVSEEKGAWQTEGVTPSAQALLKALESKGSFRLDSTQASAAVKSPKELKAAATLLEARLLAHSHQIHTERGAHAKVLESWAHWKNRRGVRGKVPTVEKARDTLLRAVEGLLDSEARPSLPWDKPIRSKRPATRAKPKPKAKRS
jgi:hypothetical protein